MRPYRDPARPNLAWVVSFPGRDRPRSRRFFTSEKEAAKFSREKSQEIIEVGRAAAALTARQRQQAAEAFRRLEAVGKSDLLEAVDGFIAAVHASVNSIACSVLAEELIDSLRTSRRSERYLTDVESRLGIFLADFGDKPAATVTAKALAHWLAGLKVAPVTRNNFRRILGVLFSFAVRRGYAAKNPIESVETTHAPAGEIAVFTPAEMRTLLSMAAADVSPEFLVYLILGGFAGLRDAEIQRLRWENIRIARGVIEIGAAQAKGARRRIVDILPAAAAWFGIIETKTAGEIWAGNFVKRLSVFKRRAAAPQPGPDGEQSKEGVPWRHNALRHSFASYHLAFFKNAPATSLLLGHTGPTMLWKNYREMVSPEDAAEWWAIRPASNQSAVVPFATPGGREA